MFGCKNWRLELPIRNLKSRIPAFGCSWHSRAAFQTNSESPPARLHLLSCDTKGFHSVLVGIGSRVPVRTEQETERAREERRGGEEHGATRPGGGDNAEFPEELVPREAYWRYDLPIFCSQFDVCLVWYDFVATPCLNKYSLRN